MTRNNPTLISIIVPTYNRAPFLDKCINSIFKQTINNFEIIIVDDGSLDSTSETVEKYSKNFENIYYVNPGKQNNISKLRNIGIKKAKGDYIAFCDDDDLWLPQKLEVQSKYLKDFHFLCTNANLIGIDDKILVKRYLQLNGNQIITIDKLLEANSILTPSVIFNRKLIGNQDPFDELKYKNLCEDYNLWLNLAVKTKILFIDEILISVRRHDSATSSIVSKRKIVYSHIDLLSNFIRNPIAEIRISAYRGLFNNRLGLINEYKINGFQVRRFLELSKLIANLLKPGYFLILWEKIKRKIKFNTVKSA